MQEKWIRRLDRWHLNDKEEMEVSEALEQAYYYTLNMRRTEISEAYQMERDDFTASQKYSIRGVWRRYLERRKAAKQAKEDAKPKYVDFEELMEKVTEKARDRGELHPDEGTDSTLSEFPSADDTPEENYKELIAVEMAERERLAAIKAGLLDEDGGAEITQVADGQNQSEGKGVEGGAVDGGDGVEVVTLTAEQARQGTLKSVSPAGSRRTSGVSSNPHGEDGDGLVVPSPSGKDNSEGAASEGAASAGAAEDADSVDGLGNSSEHPAGAADETLSPHSDAEHADTGAFFGVPEAKRPDGGASSRAAIAERDAARAAAAKAQDDADEAKARTDAKGADELTAEEKEQRLTEQKGTRAMQLVVGAFNEAGERQRKRLTMVPGWDGENVDSEAWTSGISYGKLGNNFKFRVLENEMGDPVLHKEGETDHYVENFEFPESVGGVALYKGWWLNSLPHGRGKAMYRKDNKEGLYLSNGDWVKGQWHGYMVLKWNNGNIFQGRMVRNVMHGEGHWITKVDDAELDRLHEVLDADHNIKILADSKDDGTGKSAAVAMFEELGLDMGGVNAFRRKSSLIRQARRQVREADTEYKELVAKRNRRDELLRNRKKKKRVRTDLHWGDVDTYPLDSSDSEEDKFIPPWTEVTDTEFPWEDYRGDFKKGERHGLARWRLADGSVYEGEIHRGKFHGYGVMEYHNGDRYEGEWHKGKRHGEGKMIHADGAQYHGEYKNNQADGRGVRTLPDGCRFKGTWKEGVKHGRLTLYYPNDDRREGRWRDGFLDKWLCQRISEADTQSFVEYMQEDPEHLKGIVAQNAVQRWQVMQGRELCEKVPPGVDPNHPAVVPLIQQMEEALFDLKTQEAEERLRGDIKDLVQDMTRERKEADKQQEIVNRQRKLLDTTAEEVRRRHRLLAWTQEQNEETAKGIREKRDKFKAQYDAYVRTTLWWRPLCVTTNNARCRFYSGSRLCLRKLSESVIAQLSSFLKPPELLDWAVTGLFMVVTGIINATPWHGKRQMLQQFTEDGQLSCDKFRKSMALLQPSEIDDDVAFAVEDLYVDDPRFNAEWMLNAPEEAVAPGLREPLAVMVQWITNMLECRKLQMEIDSCDHQIEILKQGESEYEERWQAKAKVLTIIRQQTDDAEAKLKEKLVAFGRAKQELQEATDTLRQGQALQAEIVSVLYSLLCPLLRLTTVCILQAAEQEQDDPDAKEADDLLATVAGGDTDKLRGMIKEATKRRKRLEKEISALRADITKQYVDNYRSWLVIVLTASTPCSEQPNGTSCALLPSTTWRRSASPCGQTPWKPCGVSKTRT